VNFIVASQILLWLAVLALSLVCLVLARQIGVLHLRLAPAGALALPQRLKTGDPAPRVTLTSLDGSAVAIGGVRGGRSQLVLFLSPDCSVCAALLPAVRSAQGAERGWLDIVLAGDGDPDQHRAFVVDKDLGRFPYVLSELLGRSYGVAKLPYAVLIDEAGKLSAAGLCNTREHLESLFLAKESGISSIQQYLGREPKRAAGE
jgi:methylamine dehydrogenase accessory protein MauD